MLVIYSSVMAAPLASLFKYTGGMSAEQQEGENGGVGGIGEE